MSFGGRQQANNNLREQIIFHSTMVHCVVNCRQGYAGSQKAYYPTFSTHPPLHLHAYRPTHCPPAFAFDPLAHSLPPPSPTNTHTLLASPPPASVLTAPVSLRLYQAHYSRPLLPVHTPPGGGSEVLRAQRQIAFFGEKTQLFFLQYGSLLSLRFFPLHPGRLVHTF